MIRVLASIILSPEVIFAAAICGLWMLFPSLFVRADMVCGKLEPLVVLGSFAFLNVTSITCCWKILFPARNANTLAKWPLYRHFRTSALAGVAMTVIGSATGVIGATGRETFPAGVPSLLTIVGYVVAATAAFTMLSAAMRVRAVVAGGS